VVTRSDIKAGQQAVQAGHSAVEFQHQYPDISKKWLNESKYLIYLSVPGEKELIELISKLKKFNLKHSIFKEPDLNDQITSVCIEPSEKTRKLTSSLPLMLKENERKEEICRS